MQKDQSLYRIYEFSETRPPKKVSGLPAMTLEEARKYCSDPETSSKTTTNQSWKSKAKKYGHFFHGFTRI